MSQRTRRLLGTVAIVAAIALAAGACSGSSNGDDKKASGDESTTTTAQGTDRPEGEWNIVRWQTARAGAPQMGDAQASVSKLEPTCKSGPCDIEVTPAGAQGTYRPEGYPLTDPVEPGEPYTLTWDEATGSYFNSSVTTTDCTTTSGDVADGYSVTRVTRLQFHPATKDQPESLHGTMEESAKGTPEGAAKGCTDYAATWSVAGAPVGAFDGADGPAFADAYTVTEIVDATQPAETRPRGFRGIILEDAAVTVEGDTAKLVGTLGTPATLREADGTWSGSATSDTGRCSEGEGPGEYDSTEQWSELRAVAATEDGAPILVGHWEQIHNPNAAGTSAGCTMTSNQGFVILVPKAAVDGTGSGAGGGASSADRTAPESGGSSTSTPTTMAGHGTGH